MDRDELVENFSSHEVATVESMLACMPGATSSSKLRRLIMLFLRGHYSSPQNYEEEDFGHLRCYVWHPDKKSATLHVGFSHEEDADEPDNYPGIFVGFSGTSFEKVALGNIDTYSQDLSTTHMAKQATMNLSVHHVASRASDAFDLAEMTATILTVMAAPMALNAGAQALEVLGIKEPARKNPSPKDQYRVAVEIQITYILGVSRYLESHRIRRIAQIVDI
jgi:hypothetical protein